MRVLSPATIFSQVFLAASPRNAQASDTRCRVRGIQLQAISTSDIVTGLNDTMVELRNGYTTSDELIWSAPPPETNFLTPPFDQSQIESTSFVDFPGIGVLFDTGLFVNVTFINAGTDSSANAGVLCNIIMTR